MMMLFLGTRDVQSGGWAGFVPLGFRRVFKVFRVSSVFTVCGFSHKDLILKHFQGTATVKISERMSLRQQTNSTQDTESSTL